MKIISFKILVLCILIPPILYILTLRYSEKWLKEKYTTEIENIYIGDTAPMLNGSIRLKDAVRQNIVNYLNKIDLIHWGMNLDVKVITKKNTVIYPEFYESAVSLEKEEGVDLAAENLALMNEGFIVSVDVKLGHATPISLAILAFYLLISMIVLFLYYRADIRKNQNAEKERIKEISRLKELETDYTEKLNALGHEKEILLSEHARMKAYLEKEKMKAGATEDEMISEIMSLEEKLREKEALQTEQLEEIEELREKIRRYEGRKDSGRAFDTLKKRFNALYKNVSMYDRAIEGYLDLEEDMRIKSEEIIHQLNDDSSLVTIKRKVFGKKGKSSVLEVLFSYKGRLYFRKTRDNKIEVLAIGTKNTQAKDLEYLDSI